MNFWEKVEQEIKKTGVISRKKIALETGIPVQTINRAIERDSRVYLDVAEKIAILLKKPIEFFLEDNLCNENRTKCINQYYKYEKLIQVFEKLDESDLKLIYQLAKGLEEKKEN